MQQFNVLSLFDGCSCAMIALQKLGINPTNYYASEIDKYAIQVSKANWPQIIHIGDVTKVHYFEGVLYTEFGEYEVDFTNGLICGGSPCQGFSFAGKQRNFEDPRSKLFFDFVRIWKEIKAECPSVKVFLENVVMKKEYQAVISQELGISPILINSALVSAQNRKRLYWTDIPFQGQPEDRGILLKHILEYGEDNLAVLRQSRNDYGKAVRKEYEAGILKEKRGKMVDLVPRTDGKSNTLSTVEKDNLLGVVLNRGEYQERNEKAMCLDANYWKGADNHGQRTLIQVASLTERRTEEAKQIRRESMKNGRDFSPRRGKELVERTDEKANCLTATQTVEHTIMIKQINPSKDAGGKQPYMQDRVYHTDHKSIAVTAAYGSRLNVRETMLSYRKLTPVECERLQCVPDNYTGHVSDSQRYRMLGNGWNVDTIVHLFEPLLWLDII